MESFTGSRDDTRVGRLLRDRPHQTQARPDRVLRRRHRPREPDCPRRSSLPGVPETAWSDRDGSPQRSASSDPPANRTRILSREAKQAMRFYTGWVIFDRSTVSARYRLFIRYLPNCCITATDVQGQRRNWKIADPAALIPGILSKIRPRNCPDQSYLSCITDSGPRQALVAESSVALPPVSVELRH